MYSFIDPPEFESIRLPSVAFPSPASIIRNVFVPGLILTALFIVTAVLWDGSAGKPHQDRPILLVLTLYLVAFAVAILTLRNAVRIPQHESILKAIVAFGIVFRLIQLFSSPYLEIDIYRYLWDGIVLSEGVSPYQWSPAEALADPNGTASHQQIVDIANSSASVHTIASKIHFPQYTSIYPPVSQAIFGATMWFVPNSASPDLHLTSMKSVLVMFDLGTMFLVLSCLRLAGRHPNWILAYAWNPLVIKEVANSGHLDSIAVFFVTAAVWVAMREFQSNSTFRKRIAVVLAVLIGLGVGSKLFPVVLIPLIVTRIWKRGKAPAVVFGITVAVACVLVMSPMLAARSPDSSEHRNGLQGFLSKWRMNSLPFCFVYENVSKHNKRPEPWYSVIPKTLRQKIRESVDLIPGRMSPANKAARLVTISLFGATYFTFLIWRLRKDQELQSFPVDVFFVLTLFLFLQPTVNPWYWTWVIPFACFVRKFGWHFVGGCLLIYYSRFWFQFSNVTLNLGEVEYSGVGCFDHLVLWGEYALLVAFVVFFSRLDAPYEGARDH